MRYNRIEAARNDKRPHLIIYIRWGLIHFVDALFQSREEDE